MATEIVCCECGKEIEPIQMRTAWPEIVGYDPPRKGGGGNQIVCRRTTGRLAHELCGKARQWGLTSQESLL